MKTYPGMKLTRNAVLGMPEDTVVRDTDGDLCDKKDVRGSEFFLQPFTLIWDPQWAALLPTQSSLDTAEFIDAVLKKNYTSTTAAAMLEILKDLGWEKKA